MKDEVGAVVSLGKLYAVWGGGVGDCCGVQCVCGVALGLGGAVGVVVRFHHS